MNERVFIFIIKNAIPAAYKQEGETIRFNKRQKPSKIIKFWPLVSEIQEFLYKMGVHKAQLSYSLVTGQVVLVYFIDQKEILVSIKEYPSHLENMVLLKKWVENEKTVRCAQLKITFTEINKSHE